MAFTPILGATGVDTIVDRQPELFVGGGAVVANALLDFVISLLRDPEAAARFDADPSQALADAGLTEVTIADVQNLIPVVAESLPMPAAGSVVFGAESTVDVWTSGAATAALDAFDLPVPTAVDVLPVMTPVVTEVVGDIEVLAAGLVSASQVDELVVEPAVDAGHEDWVPPVGEPHPVDPAPGFDVFE
ncbi:Rv0340 family IniB-related protein [Mycolicibacterium sp.]|uniref:Rv0340 family IniB-related protein n=1 Tax=Mycolicibacterium sp. TaxID=2320850 RepID=UPI003D13FA4A